MQAYTCCTQNTIEVNVLLKSIYPRLDGNYKKERPGPLLELKFYYVGITVASIIPVVLLAKFEVSLQNIVNVANALLEYY